MTLPHIKTTLTKHQKTAFNASIKMRRYIVCIDTGGGKSLLGLALADELAISRDKPAFVLCPKSAMVTWKNQIKEHTTFTFSENKIDLNKHINIVSYSRASVLMTVPKEFCEVLLLDETHILKSGKSKIGWLLRGKTGIMPRFYIAMGFTASPLMNHLDDLYYLIESFFPGYFKGYNSFMDAFTIRRLRRIKRSHGLSHSFKEVIGYKNLDMLERVIKPVMFRHAINYDIRFDFKKVNLSQPEGEAYKLAGKGILSENYREFVARLPDLQQVVNGSIVVGGCLNREPLLSSKEAKLMELLQSIEKDGGGAIVFTNFLSTMKRFRHMQSRIKGMRCFHMSGDSDMFQRNRIAKELKPGCVLFSTMVGGVSLNFQAVNNVIFYDIPWSVGAFCQCLGRVARMDSTYPYVNAYIVIANGTIDEYKSQLMQSNLGAVKQVLGGFNFAEINFKKIRRRQIVALRRALLWKMK